MDKAQIEREARDKALVEAADTALEAFDEEYGDEVWRPPYMVQIRGAILALRSVPQPEAPDDCPECKGTGLRDSGGVHPWGEHIMVPCDHHGLSSEAPDEAMRERVAKAIFETLSPFGKGTPAWENLKNSVAGKNSWNAADAALRAMEEGR